MHQVGSLDAARRALRDGADALIARVSGPAVTCSGSSAHGETLLTQVLQVAEGKPVLLAGGIATADDVKRALALGAAAAVAGSRYVLTHESPAHPAYQERILGAKHTVLTQLFGVGWTLKHRVGSPNAATARWCDAEGRIPGWLTRAQSSVERK